MKVKNKVILITGGGNGLGRELTLDVLRRGGKAIAVDVNEAALEETARLVGKYSGSLMTARADITDEAALSALPEKIAARFGAVDGIVNNAGIIQPFRKVADMDAGTIERVFRINFFGALNVTRIFLPHLLRRPEGHIVNVSSMGGFLPVAGQSVYGASKAAVKILSEGLASELSDTGVGVTTVFPGALLTGIKANSGLGADAGAGPEGVSANAAFSPAKAAAMIVDAIERGRERLYIGRDAKTMNFLYRLNPALATRMIYRQIRHRM